MTGRKTSFMLLQVEKNSHSNLCDLCTDKTTKLPPPPPQSPKDHLVFCVRNRSSFKNICSQNHHHIQETYTRYNRMKNTHDFRRLRIQACEDQGECNHREKSHASVLISYNVFVRLLPRCISQGEHIFAELTGHQIQ